MAPLAAELEQRGILARFIAAGYPIGWQKLLALRLPQSSGVKRFLDRKESISTKLICSQPLPEVFFKIGDIFFRRYSEYLQQQLHRIGFYFYSKGCAKAIRLSKPSIYHFRNCYGMSSVTIAKSTGAIALCDHSIAHPICLSWMERNKGSWPRKEDFFEIGRNLYPLHRQMKNDLDLAEHVLVNSDFVKETCTYIGMPPDKIHVVYLGVDDSFFNALSSAPRLALKPNSGSLLYAGGWQRRKGVDDIASALMQVSHPWSLDIAGSTEPEILKSSSMRGFLSDKRVNRLGVISRTDLAKLMRKHRVFIFPSYCEGSARVIFEAMAAGCYIITTKNSGSIVKDGIHGRIVREGDVNGLVHAINEAINNPDLVERIGNENANLVATDYRQSQYADRAMNVYKGILDSRHL
ncbi:MAG: glycosyltransferase [Hydrogenophaga sp.]|uniref:glycosyltransferase n=1 Tax=Hydrogenophaga sp. TaxID=1904254 RepID=UPI0025C34E48|nr:glycosyltransferase [Hydrogenophaga sp.]MCG2658328.1 glycosyltransferase [Hydrogenophaga sp.]